MATTGNLWNKSNNVGTSTGEKWVEACPISTLNSALNNTSYVPTNAKITGLKLHVKADFDLGMIFGNVYLRYGWGGTSSINKELLSSSKMTSTNELEYPSGGVDIYSYLKSVYSPFSLKTDNGNYLAFAFTSSNVTSKTYKITSVTLEITYETHNHSYTTVVSETASTCLATGSRTKKCSCGATTTETIAKLSHSYTGAIKNDSNSKTGTHSYKCVNGCNQYGGAKTHTWDSGVQTTAPTCTTNGVKTYTCTASGCGGKYTESISALGHSWGATTYTWSADGKTCTAKRVCGRSGCGATETATATITSAVKTNATCTEKGTTRYTATFGVSWATTQTKDVQDIPSKGHTSGATVVENRIEATCTTNGSYDNVVYCSVCGEELSRNKEIISAKGHTVVQLSTVPPTCTRGGSEGGSYCSDCGEFLEPGISIPPLGHDYIPNLENGSCGYIEYICSRCGDSYKETNASVGHDYQEIMSIDPTCESVGSKTFKCSHCGDTYEVTISAKGHTVVQLSTVPPTCTRGGSEGGSYCSDCGEFLEPSISTPPLGHDYIPHIVEPDLSSDLSGYTEYICSRCGDSYKDDYVYIITFKNGNGSTLETVAVPEGEMPICQMTPTKASTTEYKYTFSGWSPTLGEATANQVYTPIFKEEKKTYQVSTIFSPSDGGIVLPVMGFFEYGQEITLTATPNEGYKFVQWEDGNTDNQRTVKVTGSAQYIAIFEKLPPEFTSASMTYLNKQISSSNKVICKEGFIISVAVT